MNTICSFSSSQASQPSVFYLSLFSGNFYPSPCTLPWFWVSLLSLLNVAETPTFTPKPTFGLPFSTSFFEKARRIASSPLTSSQAPISLHPLSDSSQELCLLSLPVFPLSQSMAPKIHLETSQNWALFPSPPFSFYLSSPEALPVPWGSSPDPDWSHCFLSSSSVPSANNSRIHFKKPNCITLFSKISGFS